MPIETAERIYAFFPLVAILIAAGVFWHPQRNYASDDVFAHPESLTENQLRNIVGFGRMVMKNSPPHSARWKQADRRERAAMAELDRRGRPMPSRRR